MNENLNENCLPLKKETPLYNIANILKVPHLLRVYLCDPLIQNASYLMFSSLTSASSGFFFWLVSAKFYSVEDIGIASGIISAMSLVTLLSLLGFEISLIIYLSERDDKTDLINTCLGISFLFSLLVGGVFVFGINIWNLSLSVLLNNKLFLGLFLMFGSFSTLNSLQSQGIFAGLRKPKYSFYKTILIFTRIGIVPMVAGFGYFGIYIAYGVTPILGFLLGIYFTSKLIRLKLTPLISRTLMRSIFKVSFSNYLASIFENIPTFILPILVLNVLGAKSNAFFFIAWQIALLLTFIPKFTSVSLIAEGLNGKDSLSNIQSRASKFIFALLTVGILGVLLFGKLILAIFGQEYADNSYYTLAILTLGSIPYAFNVLYASTKRLNKENMPVIVVYAGIAIITLIVGCILMNYVGIIGISIGWVVGNGIVALGVVVKRWNQRV